MNGAEWEMGREFLTFFDGWAETYDQSIAGHDPQYEAVFANYNGILKEVVQHASGNVLEFGTGTGNLSKLLLQAGHEVIGIEPSKAMREVAKGKLPELVLLDGDFIDFPRLTVPVETIVSTYAFHHLTDEEKGVAIKQFAEILPVDGKVVFGDTMFITEEVKQSVIDHAIDSGFNDLAEDLRREYYPKIDVLKHLFKINNFDVTFKQMNSFVWVLIAAKKETGNQV